MGNDRMTVGRTQRVMADPLTQYKAPNGKPVKKYRAPIFGDSQLVPGFNGGTIFPADYRSTNTGGGKIN